MKRGLPVIAALTATTGACNQPTDLFAPEPEPGISDTGISLDGMSFFFPAQMSFEGAMENCPSLATECPMGDDTTNIVWRSGDVEFEYFNDPCAGIPVIEDTGERITINGRPAFRRQIDDGGTRYSITNYFGGANSAPVAIWKQPEKVVFWGTCYDRAGCEAVLQTLASVNFRSAEDECMLMFPPPVEEWVPPPDYRLANPVIPPPQAPFPDPDTLLTPPPPPPPAPRPRDAQELCKDYLNAA